MTGAIDAAVDVWALIAVNFLGVALGAVITAISYWAYRSQRRRTALRNATAGFLCITLGTATEPVYQLGIAGTHVLASDRNVPLQLFEGALVSLGFLLLFFSVYRYRSRTLRRTVTVSGVDDDLFDGPD